MRFDLATMTSISICIPSTVVSGTNGYNLQQATSIAYQIARAATFFSIKEIVILEVPEEKEKSTKISFEDEDLVEKNEDALLVANLLQFFITPPYLVKSIFKKHILKKFKYAYKLPKISTIPISTKYKEGISVAKKSPKIMKKGKEVKGKKLEVTKYINIGENEPIKLAKDIPLNSRVTVDLKEKKLVSLQEAYGKEGNLSSFGYYVRIVKKFSQIFTESSIETGYSKTVFINCGDYFNKSDEKLKDLVDFSKIKNDDNLLLIFGNLSDFNRSFQNETLPVEKVTEMFDNKLLISSNIRIEDGLFVALTKATSTIEA